MVSDFTYVESDNNNDEITFRLWARNEVIKKMEFVKDKAQTIVKYYENYFQDKFSYSKLDVVAIPEFAAGAKGNWGLIIYDYVNAIANVFSMKIKKALKYFCSCTF